MAVTIDAAGLRRAVNGLEQSRRSGRVDRLLAVVSALVEGEAPDAPSSIQNEAAIRAAAWLFPRLASVGELSTDNRTHAASAVEHPALGRCWLPGSRGRFDRARHCKATERFSRSRSSSYTSIVLDALLMAAAGNSSGSPFGTAAARNGGVEMGEGARFCKGFPSMQLLRFSLPTIGRALCVRSGEVVYDLRC